MSAGRDRAVEFAKSRLLGDVFSVDRIDEMKSADLTEFLYELKAMGLAIEVLRPRVTVIGRVEGRRKTI